MFTQPPIVKFRFVAGAVHTKRFTWKAGGVPVDLTGWTARMEIRDKADAETDPGELAYAMDTTPGVDEGTITLGSGADNVTFGPLPGPLPAGEYVQGMKLTSLDESESGWFFVGSLTVESPPGVVA